MKRILILIFLCIIPQLAGAGTYYYVATYKTVTDDYNAMIALLKVDLDKAKIVDSLALTSDGCLLNEKPIKIKNHRKKYYVVFVQEGTVAKNTGPGPGTSRIFYIDHSLNLKKIMTISGADIIPRLQDYGGDGYYLEINNDSSAAITYPDGIYSINSNFDLVRLDSLPKEEENSINPAPFKYLIKIPGDSLYNLYYGWKDSQYWLVKLDSLTQAIEKYSQLRFSGGAATLFAYHPKRDLFYCLKVNYEIPSDEPDFKPKTRLDYYIDPEVVIYDPESLNIIKRIPIADYPDGEYPGKENGLADVVGDYIVYYFFKEEHYTRYDPAMLLIFDTRTNEATWLRVGWR